MGIKGLNYRRKRGSTVKTVILYAKPVTPPVWWPRNERGHRAWVVVDKSGAAWSLHASRRNRIKANMAAMVREEFEDAMGRKFRWKAEAV